MMSVWWGCMMSCWGLPGRVPDEFLATVSVVPVSFRSDGVWIWLDIVCYYLEQHGLASEEQLLAHTRNANRPARPGRWNWHTSRVKTRSGTSMTRRRSKHMRLRGHVSRSLRWRSWRPRRFLKGVAESEFRKASMSRPDKDCVCVARRDGWVELCDAKAVFGVSEDHWLVFAAEEFDAF
ncbi:hypothetical protein [Saccharopolyspora spinosa]